MGNELQGQCNFQLDVLSPSGQQLCEDYNQWSVKSRDQQDIRQALDIHATERRRNCARCFSDLPCTGNALNLRLDWNQQLHKEYYSHHLMITHTGTLVENGRTMIKLELDLTLSGFYTKDADELTSSEIRRAKELSEYILSQLKRFYQLQVSH